MTNAKALLIIGFASMAVFASAALGGAPMGPPMALLGEGHWGFGGEYGHGKMDLEGDGSLHTIYGVDSPSGVSWSFDEKLRVDALENDMFFATVGYGICDNWDVFVRLGAADAKGDVTGSGNIPADPHDPNDVLDAGRQQYDLGSLDSNFGFACGVGTRATLCRWGRWSFGGLAQATWFSPQDSSVEYTDPLWGEGVRHVGDATLEYWQAQLSLAASYQVDTWRFWLGPFFQYVNGKLDRKGDILYDGQPDKVDRFDASSDVELAKDESMYGAHFGADWGITPQVDLWAEGQVSLGDTWLVGIGLIIKP